MILPVIMAGGSGTRLWPLSRGNYPKQFLALDGSNHTMLQQTISRLSGIEHKPAMLICNEEHRFIAAEQVRQLNVEHSGIFLEPVGRNTAPAIALAAFKAIENKLDEQRSVTKNPNYVDDYEKLQTAMETMTELETEYLGLMEEKESLQ